jgi:hypothetical protein
MINGRWALYAADAHSNGSVCALSVKQGRNFSGHCNVSGPNEEGRVSVTGTLRVSRACSLSGKFRNGGRIAGTLQINGQGGAGLLGPNDFDELFHFSLIRRP